MTKYNPDKYNFSRCNNLFRANHKVYTEVSTIKYANLADETSFVLLKLKGSHVVDVHTLVLGEVMVCVLDFKRDVGLWHGVLTVSDSLIS